MDIQMFIEAAIQSSKDVDYSEKSEIRTHNQAIDCYRKIAKNTGQVMRDYEKR